MTLQPVSILDSQMRMMESSHTSRSYRITISLPRGYSISPGEAWRGYTPAKWPVVYLLDAYFYFGMVTDIIRMMALCGSTTGAIVVGIGYAEDDGDLINSFRESTTRRVVDLTPVRDEAEEKWMEQYFYRPTSSGDAGGFLKFISDELIPQVEKEFQADPSRRILVGHSLGGLFAAYALFEAPGLFDTLVIGSPALSYGNRFTFQREESFAKENKQLPAKVFLFAGELEEEVENPFVTDMLRLAAILQDRKYKGFSLVKQVFLDQNHCDVIAPGYQAGLKAALKK